MRGKRFILKFTKIILVIGFLFLVAALYTNTPVLAAVSIEQQINILDGTMPNNDGNAPVSVWKMDEGTGTSTTADSIGNNTGTLVGSPTWVTGKVSNALQFNGSTQTVNLQNPSSLSFEYNQAQSYEAWINTTTDTNMTIYEKKLNAAPYTGYGFMYGTGGYIYFQMISTYSTSTLEVRTTNAMTSLTNGQWHHIAVTYDGSAAPSGVVIYIDGVSQATTATINTTLASIITSANAYIGSRNGASQMFAGSIDEVRIYQSVRTAAQVLSDMDMTNGQGNGMIKINTGQYGNTLQYYFEVVGSVSSGNGNAYLVYNGGTGTTSTGGNWIGVTGLTSAVSRVRSAAFTPTGNQLAYANLITGNGVTIKAARIIIVQSNSSYISSTETQIEVGNTETTTQTGYTPLASPKIYHYSSGAFVPTPTINFTAALANSTAGQTAYASLFVNGTTCTTQVTGSEVTVVGVTWTIPAPVTVTLSNNTDYMVCIKASANTAQIAGAKLLLDQSSSITSLEVVDQYNNTNVNNSSSSYVSQNYFNNFNQANWSGATLTAQFESDLKTSSGSNAYFAQLSNGLGQQTATDTTYTRKRGTNIWSNLPISSTDIDVQIKNASTSTTSSSNSWLVITFTNPTQIVFTNSNQTITAGSCSGVAAPLTIQLQNANGTPANPNSSTTVQITTSSTGTFSVYSDSGCTSQLSSGNIAFTTAQNTQTFYIIDTKKSNATWTLTATKTVGSDTLSNGTQTYTVNAGSMTQLIITLPSQSFTDGTGNSGSVTAQTAGSSFSITKISATDQYSNVNPNYSGSKTLVYSGPHNAPNAQAPSYTTSVSFTNGQSTTTLTTTLYDAETTTITVTDGGLYGLASSSLGVNPGILDHYNVVVESPQSVNMCFSRVNQIFAQDQWNNFISTDASTINMTTTGSGITFYTDNACTVSTTQYIMSSGHVTIYVKTPTAQSGITVTSTKNLGVSTGVSASFSVNTVKIIIKSGTKFKGGSRIQ